MWVMLYFIKAILYFQLSISEYRLRHKCVEGSEWGGGEAGEEEGSRSSASLSPQRLDAAAALAADDLEQRLHRDLAAHQPKGKEIHTHAHNTHARTHIDSGPV